MIDQLLAQHDAQLLSRTVRYNAELAQKMREAYETEPVLAHGHFVSASLQAYVQQAAWQGA